MTMAIHVDGFRRMIAMASHVELPNKIDNKHALKAVRALLCVGQFKGKEANFICAVVQSKKKM